MLFESLVKVKFNWAFFILLAVFVRAIMLSASWMSYLAMMIALWQFILLFNSIGFIIPIRFLLGSFMCLQFLVGPCFAYNGLDPYQYEFYKMQVPEADYFSYALPGVFLFIIGLHVNAGKLKGEHINLSAVKKFVEKNQYAPQVLIILGFVSSILGSFFGSELAFVFYLLGGFKFIGLFLLILGEKKLKLLPMVLVIGSIISSSLVEGMFHDLLTWIIFTAAVLGIKYKFGFNIKLAGTIAFICLVALIQVLKGSYRQSLGTKGGSVATFANLAKAKNEERSIFSFETLAGHNVRINQGFIVTNIMITVPARVPFENGKQLLKIIESAILPRILAPDKLRAGDRQIFMKYSGMILNEGTSMSLGSLGDFYVNFGTVGGMLCMFFYGILFSLILNLFSKLDRHYPVILLFLPIIFYYPIRPDCELQTILGHLFKSSFIIVVMWQVWKHQFYFKESRLINRRKGFTVAQ